VQLTQGGGDMVGVAGRRNNGTCETVLDTLQTLESGFRKVIVERVAVIEFGGDKGIDDDNGRAHV